MVMIFLASAGTEEAVCTAEAVEAATEAGDTAAVSAEVSECRVRIAVASTEDGKINLFNDLLNFFP